MSWSNQYNKPIFWLAFATLLVLGILASGCKWLTPIAPARIVLMPPSQKVVGVSWKGSEAWYLTRPMRADELPEVLELRPEDPVWGMRQSIIIQECRK